MKKKNRWRKLKSMIKNAILICITTFAALMFIASLEALVELSVKAIVVFFVSLAWLVLFCNANGIFLECP